MTKMMMTKVMKGEKIKTEAEDDGNAQLYPVVQHGMGD